MVHKSLVVHIFYITCGAHIINASYFDIISGLQIINDSYKTNKHSYLEVIVMSKTHFDKLKVNLWVSGTTNKEGDGGWCAHLHCCIAGKHYTKTLGGYGKDTTPTRMTLQAILHGLQALKKDKAVIVHIYTSVANVSSGLNKNMYQWRDREWLTQKNQQPKHLDLWKQIHAILTSKEQIIGYKVHLQNQTNSDQPHRLLAVHTSAEYLQKGKQDLYEAALV